MKPTSGRPAPKGGPDAAAAQAGEAMARPMGWFGTFCFGLLKVGVGIAFRLWFRLRAENEPRLSGAYVLAANHTSYLDPILLGAASRRRITFLMTEVIWRSPVLGWFYRWNRAIPLSMRSANRDALRAARLVLRQGRVVGIFPEGGLSRDGGLMLGNPGAVSLVLNEGVPIVPVAVRGAFEAMPPGAKLPRPRRITVRFGEPILPAELEALAPGDRKARLQLATRLIMERIAALLGQDTRETELERHRRAAAG